MGQKISETNQGNGKQGYKYHGWIHSHMRALQTSVKVVSKIPPKLPGIDRTWYRILNLRLCNKATFFCWPLGSGGMCFFHELSVNSRMAKATCAMRIVVTRNPYIPKKNLLFRAMPTKAVDAVTRTKIPTAPNINTNLHTKNAASRLYAQVSGTESKY